jgi:fructosamine-3-kinase
MTSAAENHYAERVRQLLHLPVTRLSVAGAQHGYQHLTATLADGRTVFAKAVPGTAVPGTAVPGTAVPGTAVPGTAVLANGVAGPGQATAFAAEVNGLRWLAQAHAVPVPGVLGVAEDLLVMECLPPGRPTAEAAAGFGAGLARLHAAGADAFGAPWPGCIASLPLDNTPGHEWGQWYAEQRLVPYLRKASDSGALSRADAGLVEAVAARTGELAGPGEPPSRIHGDLWSGNVLWSGGRGWLIDPAAHGGHRETDLAMLALFGAPHLDAILRAYEQVRPLADGWRDRVPLHQLHPLLVHACLFGASYAGQVRAAARAALAA